MIRWAEDHPGQTALQAPAVAKQFDLRILKHQAGPNGHNVRNQREMTTLCVALDHLALGRYRQGADVLAARLKSIEAGNRDGHFHKSQLLELIPVNPEGLTTVGEKLLVKNESNLNQNNWPSFGESWSSYGKGEKDSSSHKWIPQGKGKGKKDGEKGKKGAKGKKGDKEK